MKNRRLNFNDICFNTINYAVFTLFALICIYPFYYIFLYSISNPNDAARGGIVFLPAGLTLRNYIEAFELPNIAHAAFISVARTILGTIITVFSSALFAYIVTKKELFKRKFIYRFMVITMYFNSGLIPWYITMKTLGLKNNFLLYILPTAISAYFVILIKTFIEQIPESLEESAMIDGAGYATIFIKIIFPVSMPIIATVSVFNTVWQWNSWTDNFFLANTSGLQTLQYLLLTYLTQAESMIRQMVQNSSARGKAYIMTPQSVRMTITMIVTLPIIFVYPFLQKYFVKGIMMGAIKG